MATKKRLSSGFSGSSTKQFSGIDKEVESRLNKVKMDVFTNEFDPPRGASEAFDGGNFNKRNAPYGKNQDNYIPENKNRVKITNEMHSAGDPKDQEKMDWLDRQVQKIEAPIKNPYNQFPGSYMEVSDMESDIGPEKFHAHVESKLKHLDAEKTFYYKGRKVVIRKSKYGYYEAIMFEPNWKMGRVHEFNIANHSNENECINRAKQYIDKDVKDENSSRG